MFSYFVDTSHTCIVAVDIFSRTTWGKLNTDGIFTRNELRYRRPNENKSSHVFIVPTVGFFVSDICRHVCAVLLINFNFFSPRFANRNFPRRVHFSFTDRHRNDTENDRRTTRR